MLSQDEANAVLREVWSLLDAGISDEWDAVDRLDALEKRLAPLNLGDS